MLNKLWKKTPAENEPDEHLAAPTRLQSVADEEAAFNDYLKDRSGGFSLEMKNGKLDAYNYISSLNTAWIMEQHDRKINPGRYATGRAYESSLYHRYLQIDLPFDEATREHFPRILAHSRNVADLVPESIRIYVATVAYYFLDNKVPEEIALKSISHLRELLKSEEPLSPPLAIEKAKDFLEKQYISPNALHDLSLAIMHNPEIIEQDHGNHNLNFNGYSTVQPKPLARILREYLHVHFGEKDEPNRYLLQLIDRMSVNLRYGQYTTTAVMRFLQEHQSPPDPTLSFQTTDFDGHVRALDHYQRTQGISGLSK